MHRDARTHPVESLTDREYEVLQLLAAGHNNRRVAELLVLSIHTVKWYNRQIYGKLGAANRQEAVEVARALGLLPAQEEQTSPGHHLPAPSMPLVGREPELEELQRLLTDGDARLVSIVAPGGMGKTHLALEAAQELAHHFANGVAFANLASLATAEGIVPTIAQALDLRLAGTSDDPRQQLLGFLRDKSLLLILDNCEHLLESAPLLAEIVAAAPNVRLLVTSRERLQLQAEHVLSLQGLGGRQWQTLEQARKDPAVRLFLQYGRRLRPAITLRDRDLIPMRRILQLTGGMPLALILAAAWLELFELAQIAEEIERGLGFLEADYRDLPPRQRSMRVVFASTWERLGKQERAQLASLSVFRGGFTVEAACEVASARPADLRRLLHRSLLLRGEGGRLEIHELMRQFAAEQLSIEPELAEEVRNRHSASYLALLSLRQSHLKGARSETAVAALTSDVDNIFAAWQWAVTRQNFVLLGTGAFSLQEFCARSGRLEEGLAAFAPAIEQLSQTVSRTTIADPDVLIALLRLLACQVALHGMLGSNARAVALGDKALSLFERPELVDRDTRHERALVLSQLAWAYTAQDRIDEARHLLQQCVSLFGATGDSWHMARAYFYLGGTCLKQGQFDQAEVHHRRAMHLYADLGDRHGEAAAQMALGYGLAPMGRVAEAEDLLRNSIAMFRELDDLASAARSATLLSESLSYAGRFEEALALAEYGAQSFDQLGMKVWHGIGQNRWCLAALHLGNYAAVTDRLPIVSGMVPGDRGIMSTAMDDFLIGCARLVQAQTDGAREQLVRSANDLRETGTPDYLCLALSTICCAHVLGDDIPGARAALHEGTDLALQLNAGEFLSSVLASAAFLMTQTGEAERAVELYTAARRESYVDKSLWWEDVVGCRVEAAAATLGRDAVQRARERGRALDVWDTVARLQKEL